MHFNRQTFSSVLHSFLLLQRFWVKMQKIDFYKEKNGFESSFYKIDVYVVTNWSLRLEKHQTIEILLKGTYYCPIEIITGLTDKGQFQYLIKLKGPQLGNYLYTTQFPSLR